MQLWVGLGNPGPQYAMNRHNVGFMAVDTIASACGFGPEQKKFSGWLREGRIAGHKILLLKPATFMNESGRSVAEAVRFFKTPLSDLTVFHDELDLDPFRIKVKQGGGIAGHNGLRSIASHVGGGFRRVRLGIGHPGLKEQVLSHVLGNFSKKEMEPLADMLGAICANAAFLATGDDAKFMNAVSLQLKGL